jgi:hypothetical protein
MTRLRHASLVLVVLAALLATGSGAFTTVGAERPFEVSVADDKNALLGVETHSIETANQPSHGELATLHNRFDQPVKVSLSFDEDVPNDQPKLKRLSTGDSSSGTFPETFTFDLEEGDMETVDATVMCNNATEGAAWDVAISAEGESVSVETTDTIQVHCTGGS